eukprot:Skav231702  [mRNA]  locus=scaffold1306:57790:59588:- [translate_table: standard]
MTRKALGTGDPRFSVKLYEWGLTSGPLPMEFHGVIGGQGWLIGSAVKSPHFDAVAIPTLDMYMADSQEHLRAEPCFLPRVLGCFRKRDGFGRLLGTRSPESRLLIAAVPFIASLCCSPSCNWAFLDGAAGWNAAGVAAPDADGCGSCQRNPGQRSGVKRKLSVLDREAFLEKLLGPTLELSPLNFQ